MDGVFVLYKMMMIVCGKGEEGGESSVTIGSSSYRYAERKETSL